ncbi:hypothetical protein SALBM217S_08552 [Streptomyces griseoloalbus]
MNGTHERTAEQDLPYNVFAKACPSRGTLEHVTGRWGGITLCALYEGSLRFNELRRRVDGVSEKMLSQTLHALERDGLVHREAQPTNPPRVDYELTPLGRDVAERLLSLIHLGGGSDGRRPRGPRALRRDARRPLTLRAVVAGPVHPGRLRIGVPQRLQGRPSRPYASRDRSK